MIGNDVVDILQSRTESNWQRPGFIQKLFTADEQQLILNAAEPEVMVWLLWSMKEAAYKIYNRQTKKREFIPKKLHCTILSQHSNYRTGQVVCLGNIYHTKTILERSSIHTIAVSCLNDLNRITEVENKGIIKDGYGIPYLATNIQDIVQDVSVSHHGRFEKVVKIQRDKE